MSCTLAPHSDYNTVNLIHRWEQGDKDATTVLALVTDALNSVQWPPELAEAGKTYVFQVESLSYGDDFTSPPTHGETSNQATVAMPARASAEKHVDSQSTNPSAPTVSHEGEEHRPH